MKPRRSKRTWPNVNYKELSDTCRLPRAKKLCCRNPVDALFQVTILESSNDRVKIHYDGYDSEFDEWREENEIELIDRDNSDEISSSSLFSSAPQCYQLISLYRELRNKIKRSLKCGRKSSPVVKIIMPFDALLA